MTHKRFVKVLVTVLMVLSVGHASLGVGTVYASPLAPTTDAAPAFSAAQPSLEMIDTSSLDYLLTRAGEMDNLLVLAELALPMPFTAEATTNPRAVEQQRAAIAAAAEGVLAALEGTSAEVAATFTTIPYVAVRVDAKALLTLASLPQVISIQEDVPAAPTLASSAQLIGLPAVWANGVDGSGQTVVVLDTGIDTDHPFFASRLVDGACFSNANGAGGQTPLCANGTATQYGVAAAEADTSNAVCWNGTTGLCTHGTHVAGIAAGSDNSTLHGVARGANIIAIQVFTRFNSTLYCGASGACVLSYTTDQLRALEYVNTTLRPAHSVASVNMSLGGGQYTTACDTDTRKPAIDNLRNAGIATVIAAGNDNYRNAIAAPACISSAISVGAVTDTDNPPANSVLYNIHSLVDVLAPGRTIRSSLVGGGYGNMSGTSMAAPHTAGAFALCKSVNPALSVGQIEAILEQTGLAVKDNRTNGVHTKPRLQLDAAVAACQQLAVWTGAASSDWNNPANWNGGVLPAAGAFVNVPTTPAGGRFPMINGVAEMRSLTLDNGAQLNVAGATLTVHGGVELAAGAQIDATGSTITLTGNQLAAIVLPPGQKLNNLVIGNGSDTFRAELGSNLALDGGLLTQSGAILDLGPYNMTAEGVVTNRGTLRQSKNTTSGVVEFLRIKNASGANTLYAGVDIAPSGSMGNTAVSVKGEQDCDPGAAGVQRCYDITPTAALASDITFYYNANEANGVNTPAPYHWNGTLWESLLSGQCGACGTTFFVTALGVSAYSPFMVRDNTPPLAVTLADFTGQMLSDHALLTWETTHELNNQGFIVLRSADPEGQPEPLTFVPSQGPGSAQGFSYTWQDYKIEPNTTYWYWLEDVDLAGVVTRHGPIVVQPTHTDR